MAIEDDLNGDGKVSKFEEIAYERKAKNRRRMAWLALAAMIATAFALMFFVPQERLDKLNGLLELYWISLGSITGAYVGISSWMSKR